MRLATSEFAKTGIRLTAVGVLLALVTWVDALTGPVVDASFFYFLPIVMACAWFGAWGALLTPLAFYLSREIGLADAAISPVHRLGDDLVRLLSFTLIAGLTLFSRQRYRMSREAQRTQIALRRAAETRGSRLEALYRLASAANASRGADEFLGVFLEEVTRLVPHVRLATVLEREGDELVRRAAWGDLAEGAIGERIPVGEGIAGRVAATGEALIVQEADFSPRQVASARVRQTRPASAAGVPLVLKGETVGVVVLFGEPGAVFTPEDVRALQSMASEAALVLESLRLYDRLRQSNADLQERQRLLDEQLALAREVQTAILSVCPAECRVGPVEIASYHSSAWEVGGDLVGIVPDDDGTALFVADVMGKGVPAALLMTMMVAELSSPNAPACDPGAVLCDANRVLSSNLAAHQLGTFVTAIYVCLLADGRRMRFGSAGHPPAVLAHADGTVELLATGGIVLGLVDDASYSWDERALEPGDRLVLYTDGITEARSPSRGIFGAERLQEIVVAHRDAPALELQQAIIAAVCAFMGGERQTDDIALIVAAAH